MEGGIRELAFGSQGRRHGHGHRALKLGCWPLRGCGRLDLQGRIEWICRGHDGRGWAGLHNRFAGSLF